MPVLREESPCVHDREKKEREFFSSLSHFAALYGLSTVQQDAFPYPLNVHYAFRDAVNQLGDKDPDTKLLIVSTDDTSAAIAAFRLYSTTYNLYFIPVAPLLKLMHAKKRRLEINLLCSIFAYLHKVLKIDFFSAEESYLYWMLTGILDIEEELDRGSKGAEEDDDDGDGFDINQVIRNVLKEGEKLRHLILTPKHLREFGKRVQTYKPKGPIAQALHLVAKEAFELYSNYADKSLMDSMPEGLLFTKEERHYCEGVRGDQRICFIWDSEGALYHIVSDYVNSDLQECPGFDEPVTVQLFDKPQERISLDLEFETRAIRLLEHLIDFLMNKIWKT